MNNTARHSKAGRVKLSLKKVRGKLELSVQDNGRGFNLKEVLSAESSHRGLGLASMRERTELSGGLFTIECIPGKGTFITASWPVQE